MMTAITVVKRTLLSMLCLSVLFFVGCAATPVELTQEVDSLKGQLSEVVAERDILLQEKLELRKKMDLLEGKVQEQTRRREGIKAVLFGGDIIYEIAAESYRDYREGLRFRSLRDKVFAESLASYEKHQGGDMRLMELLKEIDASRDRFLSDEEIEAFVAAEEKAFYAPQE